ncbi:hypothetical protein ACOMHN_035514 [Nucella lapillus]
MSETSLSASDLPEGQSAVSVRSFRSSVSSDDSTDAIDDVIIPEWTSSPKVTVTQPHVRSPDFTTTANTTTTTGDNNSLEGSDDRHCRAKVVAATSTTSSLSSNEEDDDNDEDEEDFTPGRRLSDASPLSSLTVSSGSEQNRLGRTAHAGRAYQDFDDDDDDEESQGLSSDSLVSLMSLSTTHSLSQHPGATQRSHSFVVTHSPTYRPPEVQLTPLPFEIPHPEGAPLFVGRQWVFREVDKALNGASATSETSAGVVLLGGIGSGKTAILEQLVAHSCFHDNDDATTPTSPPNPASPTPTPNTFITSPPPTLCEPNRNSKGLTPSPTSGLLRNTAAASFVDKSPGHLAPPHLTVKNLRVDGSGRNSPALSSDSSHSSYKTAIYSSEKAGSHSPSAGAAGKGGVTGGTCTPHSDSSRGSFGGGGDKMRGSFGGGGDKMRGSFGESDKNRGSFGQSDKNRGSFGASDKMRGSFGESDKNRGSFGASDNTRGSYGDKISNLTSKNTAEKLQQEEGPDGHPRTGSFSLHGTDIYSEKQNLSKVGGTGGNATIPTSFLSGGVGVEGSRWEGGCLLPGGGGGRVERLGGQVVAYHLCQADINVTCLVPDFVHSVAGYLIQAPRLQAYRDLLSQEPQLQQLLSLRGCIQNPSASLIKGVLEPLKALESRGKISPETALILVDSLNEAEFHRADHGDTIASFLARHVSLFPSWLKLVVACQTVVQEIVRPLPFIHVVLDKPEDEATKISGGGGGGGGGGDIYEYIHHRLLNSIPLRSNVCPYGKFDAAAQQKFCTHLQTLSKGCFLHVKLVLDLIEHGHLVVKGSNYKILPVNLSEVFPLHFNLKFSSVRAFERVANILAVCLAALYPLSLRTIFMTVNSGYVSRFVAWEDFCSRMTMLSGLLHLRRDGCYMFFHPAFREWLIRRDDSDATKFLCGLRNAEFDFRLGHALVAFRLSRVNSPLPPDKTVELGHHILKAHIYKGMGMGQGTRHPTAATATGGGPGGVHLSRELQGWWVCLSSHCLSRALVTPRNVFCPNVKVSRLLLSAGANPDARTDYLYNSPMLCIAAKQGFADMVSLLLEFGADANCTSELLGIPALCYAATCGHSEIVRLLCQNGARPSMPDKMGQTPAVHAALRGQLESLALLLQLEWPPPSHHQGEPTRSDVTLQCLVAAAGAGHKQIVEYLHHLTRGEALDLVDNLFGETATTAACIQGQSEVLQYLLEEGADTTAPNSKTLSPLLCAAMFGERQIAESLLAAGADLEQSDKFGRTALIVAASEGHFAALDMLLSKGAQLERTDQEGLTALCWACLKGHVTSVHALCACGADVNHSDRRGRVPLHLAAYHGDVQLVQYLVERGAQLDRVDTHGLRPLERAINRDNLTVVDAFLRHGAKLSQATWTVSSGKPEVMLLLLHQLMDDGNRMYKKNRIMEAAQFFRHALKRFPRERDRERGRKNVLVECLSGEEKKTYRDLKFHLLLNLSRCKRKLQDYTAAVDLATRALTLKPRSFQAYYARARAYRAADHLSSAHSDLMQALRLAPNNPDVRRLLARLQEESTPRSSRHYHESDRPYERERDKRRYEDDEEEEEREGGGERDL